MTKARRQWTWHAEKDFGSYTVVATHGEADEVLLSRDTLVMIVRGKPRALKLRCPCGCGDLLTVSVDPETHPHWRVRTLGSRLSISPSVWRETGCHSHFVLRDSKIYLLTKRSKRLDTNV